MKEIVPSENILKLRKMTEDINYKLVIDELNEVIEVANINLKHIDTPETKIKCYESMCQKIKNILSNVK